nr:uncharacterized protein LOC111847686 [Paramormyrops kingsleyae]
MGQRMWIFLIFARLFFECSAEDRINQTRANVSLEEGGSVILHCAYESGSTNPYLFWYIQYPNESPKYILRREKFGEGDTAPGYKGRFNAGEHWSSFLLFMEKSFILVIITIITGLTICNEINPGRLEVSGKEGGSVSLSCSYKTTNQYARIDWYRQQSNQRLQYLAFKDVRGWTNSHTTDERFKFSTSTDSIELTIDQLTIADTAIYYCTLLVAQFDVRHRTLFAVEPMQLGHSPLSTAERCRRSQQGLCLYCGESGHILWTCPVCPPRPEGALKVGLSVLVAVSPVQFTIPIVVHGGGLQITTNLFPLSLHEEEAMETYIKEVLRQGIIRPSTSPITVGFFFVKKKDDGLRLCINYRVLNAITVKCREPLPLIPPALEKLCEVTVFTKLDLRSAYNLVQIR